MASGLRVVWRLRQGNALDTEGAALILHYPGGSRRTLEVGSRAVADAICLLRDGAGEQALRRAARAAGGSDDDLDGALGALCASGALVADFLLDDAVLGTALAYASEFDVPPASGEPRTLCLSRFSLIRRTSGGLRLENTEAPAAIAIRSPLLSRWLAEAGAPTPSDPATARGQMLDILAGMGFLVDADAPESREQQTWTFHDRLFHRRSRRYDDYLPFGGVYPFPPDFIAGPAARPSYDGPEVALPVPSERRAATLQDILDCRRTRYEMDEHPVDVGQIAELLYRAARELPSPTGANDQARRPYPSAGAIYEIELYLAIGKCDGLEPGFYHYMCDRHAVARLPTTEDCLREMFTSTAASRGRPCDPPQAIVVLSSRVPRLAVKYAALAYRLSVLNAGVVLQTLYLLATDIGLAASAIGGSDPRLFAAATGNSTWSETSIAEFAFGRSPRGAR